MINDEVMTIKKTHKIKMHWINDLIDNKYIWLVNDIDT